MSAPAAGTQLWRSEFETLDGDQITGFLRDQYVDNEIRFSSGGRDPRFRFATTSTPILSSDRIRSSFDYGGTCDPFDYYLFFICSHGSMRLDHAVGEQRLGVGDTSFFPPGHRLDFDFREMGLHVLRLPPGYVETVAAEAFDIPAASVRFHSNEPISQALHFRWNETFALISKVLGEVDAPSPLITSQLARLLAAMALETFPNTAVDHPATGPGYVESAVLRRAIDYIDAHAHEPLSLTDIAAAAGTSARAVQYAFRTHRDTTPMSYLRQVRLERAHRELQAGDPVRGDSVADIAARWGFGSPGRFATSYRRAYGQPPSRTLRA